MKILHNDPYGALLASYIIRHFPQVVQLKTPEVVDAITAILLGTKEYRYGPLPSPESQVTIRNVIRYAISNTIAIPILIPWGSTKTDFGSGVDVAEVMAIKRLIDINEEVKKVYPMGLEIVIRIEDLSGYTLFALDAEEDIIHDAIDKYSTSFEDLVYMLSQGTIKTIKETDMENASLYEGKLKEYSHLMYEYLVVSHDIIQNDIEEAIDTPQYKALVNAGWRGYVSYEQRWHYYTAYDKLYNHDGAQMPIQSYISRLALYLGGALAKHKLGLLGVQKHWYSYIQLTFVAPIKGLPEGFADHYIYYRTLPLSAARTHICPWRSKGYLQIKDGESVAKLTSWHDTDDLDLIPAFVTLVDGDKSVVVTTDYQIIN